MKEKGARRGGEVESTVRVLICFPSPTLSWQEYWRVAAARRRRQQQQQQQQQQRVVVMVVGVQEWIKVRLSPPGETDVV